MLLARTLIYCLIINSGNFNDYGTVAIPGHSRRDSSLIEARFQCDRGAFQVRSRRDSSAIAARFQRDRGAIPTRSRRDSNAIAAHSHAIAARFPRDRGAIPTRSRRDLGIAARKTRRESRRHSSVIAARSQPDRGAIPVRSWRVPGAIAARFQRDRGAIPTRSRRDSNAIAARFQRDRGAIPTRSRRDSHAIAARFQRDRGAIPAQSRRDLGIAARKTRRESRRHSSVIAARSQRDRGANPARSRDRAIPARSRRDPSAIAARCGNRGGQKRGAIRGAIAVKFLQGIDSEQFNEIIYTANNGKADKIYLYKTRNHFDVIKSMTAFLDVAYYCHSCKKSYTRRDKHKCPQKCLACFKYFPDGNKCKGKDVTCKQCNRVFNGNSCFKNHTSNRSKKDADSVCSTVAKCLKCSQIILKPYIKIHKCGHKMCNNCNKYCENNHKCFIKNIICKGGNCTKDSQNPCRLNKTLPKKDYCYSCRTYTEKYLFFDFECTQNTGTHEVNLGICHDFNGNESIFNDINSFCNGILNEKYKGYTLVAHNSKGYDSHFILKWCIDNGFKPYCIYNGAKIMMMEITQLRIKIIDSLNFIQQRLSSFPKTFGLNELKKGYFPHYFNKMCNQHYIGNMPSKKHYGYNQMNSHDRENFLQWYDDRVNENYVFDFKKEIEYCRSDVDILRRCMLKFRQDFISQENIDPLKYITIAGVCMAIYRGNYMPKNTIAVVDNFVQTESHSAISIAWLDFISKKNNIKIQHALDGGEKVINNELKVDGFCQSTNTVYEFQGCFWHGCPYCYKPDVINTKNQCDMGTLYNKTQDKNNKITTAGYNLIEMWECK